MQNTEIEGTSLTEGVNSSACASAEEMPQTASDSIPAEENSSACLSASCADSAPEDCLPSDGDGAGDTAYESDGEGLTDGGATDEDAPKTHTPDEEGVSDEDYALQAEADMRELCALFPTLSPDGRALSLGELANPTRFAELRAAGLTVEEAFLASNYRMLTKASPPPLQGRRGVSHMKGALPRSAGGGHAMPTSLLVRTRTIFEGLSDKELTSLYHRVTQ